MISALTACFLSLAILPETAHPETFKMPLNKFTAAKRVDLRCTSAQYGISLPVPQRWEVKKATLSFSYSHSTALLPGSSRMITRLNNDPVSQRDLNPLAPDGFLRMSLPTALLKAGYNDLTFDVQQHYTLGCEFPCQPELWTTLKLTDDDAELEMEYSLREVPLRLSAIVNFLFDPKINPRGEVNIVLPNWNAEEIGMASIIASGIAMRFDYRNVVFSVSQELRPGYDNVLIGDKETVGRILGPFGFGGKEMRGPFLKIMHLPIVPGASAPLTEGLSDPTHALIVVSGLNKDHLRLAAETFAIMSAPFPDTDEMTVTGIVMPDIPLYGGRQVIKADTRYTFGSLGFPDHTFAGGNANGVELAFRLPADFLIKQNRYAELSLYYAYGAANRLDSVINISLNDKLLRGINLDDTRGALIEGYKLDIPTYLFKPGSNVLRFEAVLAPSVGKNCEYMQTKNLFLTIMEKSTIKFPPMPHYVAMPNLELFMLNGFPVTRWPDGHGSKIFLTNRSPEVIEAALNLVGALTQENGNPLLGLEYTLTQPKNFDGEVVIIGDIPTLPGRIRDTAPLALNNEMAFPYPVGGRTEGSQFAFSRQVSGLGSTTGALMEFQSPYAEGRTAVLLTASSPRGLLALSLALMKPGVQANVKGDTVLIDLNEPEKNMLAMSIGRRYFAGKAGFVSRMNAYLFTYPWLYYIALGLVVVALGLTLFYFLNRYRKKRIMGT